jgi:putative heme-binding domain-containing protein
LTLVSHAIGSMRGLAAAPSWERVAPRFYDATQPDIRRAAEAIGAAFADDALFERMRARLLERDTPPDVARHALDVLAADRDPANLPVLLDLIATGRWVPRVLPLLGRFDDPRVAEVLLRRMSEFPDAQRDAALQVLTSRAAWARGLLDAIDGGQLDASLLTAYYARQIAGLGDAQLRDRLRARWGQLSPSSAETRHQIGKLVATYQEAPLWAYSARAGAAHFKQLCANCHSSPNERAGIAPQLAGSGSKGIEYIVENILAPNAVIGRDFQARVIATVDGRVLTGLIEAESASSMTIRTQTDSVTIDKEEIEQMRISENSFMPAGLLDQLSERERIELLKYLMSL